jgi:hypothetical protein
MNYKPNDGVILAMIVALATFGLSEVAFLAIGKGFAIFHH